MTGEPRCAVGVPHDPDQDRGRLVVGAGLGSLADEFTAFGESGAAGPRAGTSMWHWRDAPMARHRTVGPGR